MLVTHFSYNFIQKILEKYSNWFLRPFEFAPIFNRKLRFVLKQNFLHKKVLHANFNLSS